METVTSDLRGWTSGELLDEVLSRCAEDRPALQLAEGKILGARLAEIDRKFATVRDFSVGAP